MFIRIGTRGSPLALQQAALVKNALCQAHQIHPDYIEICPIKTTGDRLPRANLQEIGGKALFTKEIEEALLHHEVDMAVHSMKDVAVDPPQELIFGAFLPRADPRDAFISSQYNTLEALPPGARVGTSSPRRMAQVLKARPDVTVIPLRGNVETRVKKIDQGEADATLLAVAGLERLGHLDYARQIFATQAFIPAVCQGVVGIQIRQYDSVIQKLLRKINHYDTTIAVAAERSFLIAIAGSCYDPVAAYATHANGILTLMGFKSDLKGTRVICQTQQGPISRAKSIGQSLARQIKAAFGKDD